MNEKKPRNPDVDFGFHATIPRLVRTDYKDLTPVQKWLYVCLKDLCGDYGTCYRTIKVLAEETGISTGMLSESIPILQNHGLIHGEKKKRSTGGKDVWHITIVDVWQANAKAHPTKRSQNEQTLANVHTVNENVHRMNELALKRSQNEQERSLCETEGIPVSNNSNEAITNEERERAFTSVHAPLAPADFLPGAQDEHDAQTSRAAAAHDPLPGSSSDAHALVGATADVEDDAPTTHHMPVIKLNGANDGQLNTLTASASIPGEPENSPLSVHSPHSLQGTDGAATPLVDRSEPRASGKQEKPKRRKKPVEVQLTLDAARLKEWYDELRGLSTSLSKRNVDSWESLTQKKGNDDRDMFLNIVALLDIDPWFEEHKIAVDAYWINRSWENKYIFLRGHKNVPLADKKPMDVYTAASLDPERNKRNLERLKANRLAKEAAQGVNHHGTN